MFHEIIKLIVFFGAELGQIDPSRFWVNLTQFGFWFSGHFDPNIFLLHFWMFHIILRKSAWGQFDSTGSCFRVKLTRHSNSLWRANGDASSESSDVRHYKAPIISVTTQTVFIITFIDIFLFTIQRTTNKLQSRRATNSQVLLKRQLYNRCTTTLHRNGHRKHAQSRLIRPLRNQQNDSQNKAYVLLANYVTTGQTVHRFVYHMPKTQTTDISPTSSSATNNYFKTVRNHQYWRSRSLSNDQVRKTIHTCRSWPVLEIRDRTGNQQFHSRNDGQVYIRKDSLSIGNASQDHHGPRQ